MKRSVRLLVVVVLILFEASAAWGFEGLGPQSVRGNTPASAHLDPGSRSRQAPSLTSLSHDGLSRVFMHGEIDAATYALERVRSLFSLRAVRAEYGHVARPDPRSTTMLFRDLSRNVRYLSGSDQEEAERYLARPDDGGADPNGLGYSVAGRSACSINFCVHWVETTSDAPPLTDADGTGLPDWVETITTILEEVRSTEVSTLGYRAPKSDATSVNHGADGRIDVYLVDIGPTYGITISDDPQSADPNYPYWDSSVYLVLDNDFSASQFPGANGIPALEVTAAHEFFHAVQAAYDWYEDNWFLESTATWMEEVVYDNINDNRQYLGSSPLRQPFVPMDFGNPARSNLYGDWIFWEFLTGYFGRNRPDLSVVQRVWQLADGSAGGPDYYSTAAIDQMAAERDSSFRFAFADFAAANALPKVYYEEGGSYPAPRFKNFALTANKPRLGPAAVRLDHLTSAYVDFKPGTGISRTAKLLVAVDLPSSSQGSEATVLVHMKAGAVRFIVMKLNGRGNGDVRVPFGRGRVSQAILVLTNASARFNCWQQTWFSCQGRPRDDRGAYAFVAEVLD